MNASPAGFATPGAVCQLHQRYSWAVRKSGLDLLLLIPLCVLDSLCIDPFLDGNGRMARVPTALLLNQSGYEAGRYIESARIRQISELLRFGYTRLSAETSSIGGSAHQDRLIGSPCQ